MQLHNPWQHQGMQFRGLAGLAQEIYEDGFGFIAFRNPVISDGVELSNFLLLSFRSVSIQNDFQMVVAVALNFHVTECLLRCHRSELCTVVPRKPSMRFSLIHVGSGSRRLKNLRGIAVYAVY